MYSSSVSFLRKFLISSNNFTWILFEKHKEEILRLCFLLNTSSTLNVGQLIGVVGKFNEVMMLSTLFSDIAKPYAVLSDLQYLYGKLLK